MTDCTLNGFYPAGEGRASLGMSERAGGLSVWGTDKGLHAAEPEGPAEDG